MPHYTDKETGARRKVKEHTDRAGAHTQTLGFPFLSSHRHSHGISCTLVSWNNIYMVVGVPTSCLTCFSSRYQVNICHCLFNISPFISNRFHFKMYQIDLLIATVPQNYSMWNIFCPSWSHLYLSSHSAQTSLSTILSYIFCTIISNPQTSWLYTRQFLTLHTSSTATTLVLATPSLSWIIAVAS